MSALDRDQDLALRRYRDSLRRVAVPEAAPPAAPTAEAVQAWLPAADKALRRARRAAEQDKAVCEARLAAAKGGSDNEAGWKALEDACRRIEQELLSPPTLRTRLDEGRRSMMPRVEAVIGEHLVPEITESGSRITASLDPQGLARLEAELPQWVQAWSAYAFEWLAVDLGRSLHVLWTPRGVTLPVPAPPIAPLTPVTVDKAIAFPTVNLERDRTGLGGGILRYGRSGVYGLLSVAALFGLRRGGGEAGMDPTFAAMLALGVPAAIFYGYLQAQAARSQERERLAEQARNKAEQATREVLRTWLDRCADKINAAAQEQLLERRTAFLRWYDETVLPARSRRTETAARQRAEAEAARKALPAAQDAVRELTRAREALAALAAAVN